MKIKNNWDDDKELEKTLNMYDVVIHIRSVFNKNYNYYYYQVSLEKCSYPLIKEINIIQTLYYNRINVSSGTDFNKKSVLEEYSIYHCWYLIEIVFSF